MDFGIASSRRFRDACEGAWSVTLRVQISSISLEENLAQMTDIPLCTLSLADGTLCSFVWHWKRKDIVIT